MKYFHKLVKNPCKHIARGSTNCKNLTQKKKKKTGHTSITLFFISIQLHNYIFALKITICQNSYREYHVA